MLLVHISMVICTGRVLTLGGAIKHFEQTQTTTNMTVTNRVAGDTINTLIDFDAVPLHWVTKTTRFVWISLLDGDHFHTSQSTGQSRNAILFYVRVNTEELFREIFINSNHPFVETAYVIGMNVCKGKGGGSL